MSRKNVFGMPLRKCAHHTGWTRNGLCEFDQKDEGAHTVCAIMTEEFLRFTFSRGNDLMRPRGDFRGLREGDSWCMCVGRWIEAYEAGVAPPVVLESTDESVLSLVPMSILRQFSHTWYYNGYGGYRRGKVYDTYNTYDTYDTY